MKPTFHGMKQIQASMTTKVPTDTVNVAALIETFENNLDKQPSDEWLALYKITSQVYKELFTDGELSDKTMDETPFDILEIAHENIDDDFETYFSKPTPIARNYYYEYARSLGTEHAASRLKPRLSEECDFI